MPELLATDVLALTDMLRAEIAAHLETFHERTGMTPSAIRVEMLPITRAGATRPVYRLGDIRVEFHV